MRDFSFCNRESQTESYWPDGADRGTLFPEQLGYPFEEDDIDVADVEFKCKPKKQSKKLKN